MYIYINYILIVVVVIIIIIDILGGDSPSGQNLNRWYQFLIENDAIKNVLSTYSIQTIEATVSCSTFYI